MRQPSLREHERLDDLMKSGRHIIQNTQEFCFSLDAVLLAHFPRVHPRDRVLELGTGTGVIPLLLADDAARIDAVELSPVMADLARRNVIMNELEEKIFVREGDYRAIRELYPAESFHLVLANPPYRPVRQGQANKIAGVARARHEFTATLEDVVTAAQYALRFGGHFAMVHLPERLGEIAVALHAHQMELKRLRMVQPKADKAPNMMLLEAVKGAAAGGLKVLPPLIVHEADGSYTKEIYDIYGMEIDT
ncbi:MAG: methyltransferase [Selenomonas sp.]|uniref:tRNA1(Val) (adenine(37)-N6)-methyltransferase n=1 Tax=Selenomonas sp. TaxID=2053611 RepID=UPI0025DBA1C6|nr:methyltransferase [Selenomonas sp.]MCI6231516.1 methyltransferase [Selenomonas sp.]